MYVLIGILQVRPQNETFILFSSSINTLYWLLMLEYTIHSS